MCYEFVHACASPLVEKIKNITGAKNYFMVCIRHLNYFYCNDLDLVEKVKRLLINNGITLYKITESDLLNTLDAPNVKEFQIFHGSSILYNNLQAKFRVE
jgi:hypothetical protein